MTTGPIWRCTPAMDRLPSASPVYRCRCPSLGDALDQFAEGVDREYRIRSAVPDHAPRATADPHRTHASGPCGADVVVGAVTDVGDRPWGGITHQTQGRGEELGLRLVNTKLLAHGDHVRLEAQRTKICRALDGLVGHERDAISGVTQGAHGRQ